jgi:hypothetical protein
MRHAWQSLRLVLHLADHLPRYLGYLLFFGALVESRSGASGNLCAADPARWLNPQHRFEPGLRDYGNSPLFKLVRVQDNLLQTDGRIRFVGFVDDLWKLS